MLASNKQNAGLYTVLAVFVVLNIGCWFYSSKIYEKWTNVPPAPSLNSIRVTFLDDRQFAYMASGLALQNFGSVGETQNLKSYNFQYLGQWFALMDRLDPHSNFVPYLAAYYFGATPDATQLQPVIDYLEKIGMRAGKWRWLAQAAYLERHRMHDMDAAMRVAKKLGSVYEPGMPNWTRNMEPMLRADMGDRQAAYLLMLEILKSDGDKMSASEYNSNVYLTCDTILTKEQAAKSPLCQKRNK